MAADDVRALTSAKYGNFEFQSWQKQDDKLIIGTRKGSKIRRVSRKKIEAFELDLKKKHSETYFGVIKLLVYQPSILG